jgi:hypothetical protein
MKVYFVIVLMLGNVLLTKTYAQKNNPTHFMNWFVAFKKTYNIGDYRKIEMPQNMMEFAKDHGIKPADTAEVKRQLQKPIGKLRLKRIKGVKLMYPGDMDTLQAASKRASPYHPDMIPYFTVSHPVFLPDNRIWVVRTTSCGGLCGNCIAYFFKRVGKTYELISSKLVWMS